MKIARTNVGLAANRYTFTPTTTGHTTDTTLGQVGDLSFEVTDRTATCPSPQCA